MPEARLHDHLGRPVSAPQHPQRIVSLCPSLTETLYALGLGERVVGRTRFCLHPEPSIRGATRVGGTKQIKYERLHELRPDLIIAEKEENTPEMVERLAQDYPVYVIDVQTVEDAMAMLTDLGELTGTRSAAQTLQKEIEQAWRQIPAFSHRRVAYLIWQDPLMGVGRDTYIQSVLARLGLDNVLLPLEGRYPSLTEEQLQRLAPDLLLLSSEPYPFQAKHLAAFQALLPEAEVQLVDGEMFSWYGARMLPAAGYLRRWGQGNETRPT
jgi:iron complex transport system substrate-binding protein